MSLHNIAAGYQWGFANLDDLASLDSDDDQRSLLCGVKNNVESVLEHSSDDDNASIVSIYSVGNASIGTDAATILPSSPARETCIRTPVPAKLPTITKKKASLISSATSRLSFRKLFDSFKSLANPSDGEESVSSILQPPSDADSNSSSLFGDLDDSVFSNRLRTTKDEPRRHIVATTRLGKETLATTFMDRTIHTTMNLNEASKAKPKTRGALHRSHRGSVITSTNIAEETQEMHSATAIYNTRKGMHGEPQKVAKHGTATRVEKERRKDRNYVRRASASDAAKKAVEEESGSPTSRTSGFKKKSSRSCRPKPLQIFSASSPRTDKSNWAIKEIRPSSTDAIRGATSGNKTDEACPVTHAETKRYQRRKSKRISTSSKTRVFGPPGEISIDAMLLSYHHPCSPTTKAA